MVGDRIAKEYNDTAEDKKTFRELPWALSAVKKVFEYSIETTLNSMNRFIEELYREEAIKELKELNLWGMSNAAQIASEFNDVLELHDITERDDMINAIIRITEAGNIAGNILLHLGLAPSSGTVLLTNGFRPGPARAGGAPACAKGHNMDELINLNLRTTTSLNLRTTRP